MYRILRDRNAALNEALIGFARQLISAPSPSLGEAAVAGLVERKMRELGYDKVFRDEAGNVVGLLLGREAGPTVLLNCHMDTVSPEADGKWTRSPHDAQVDGDRLYGLGAADCKGGVSRPCLYGRAAQTQSAAVAGQPDCGRDGGRGERTQRWRPGSAGEDAAGTSVKA